ncbi:MAG: ATP-binding cassette domain-containing protein [Candidatus Accumulibacter sp.]|nr:ATP-binding cassette domain-containing protein [Accumulibacter sp.]
MPVSAAAIPALAIEHLAFRWRRRDAFCLTLEQLTLAAGESLFLEGPSGSGKSTLLNLIGGAIRPERGSIRLLGEDIGQLAARRRDAFRADHLGFIFQQFNLIPYLSALDNALLSCRFSSRRAARAAHGANSPEHEARRLFAVLDLSPELPGRQAAELSVGEQQRVAAVRALLGRPEILIADEPTSALDADRQSRFVETLLGEAQKAASAVIFVSHDATLGERFDRRLKLDSGESEKTGGASAS